MLRNKVRNFLLQRGQMLGRAEKSDATRTLIQTLHPVCTDKKLIRIGGDGDGGYLVPDDFDGISACFSPGVSAISDFEDMIANNYGIRSFMVDYSVDRPPLENPMFDFEKKFLGTRNDDVFVRLEDWVAEKTDPSEQSDLLLQMDIEGAEYEVFLDTPAEVLRRFRIMVVEFHDVWMMMDRFSQKFFRMMFEKILRDFHVVHIHPNNCSPTYQRDDVEIPATMEFTFYRKDRANVTDELPSFPHPLDQVNVPKNADIVLPKVWHR